jgi:hypothetical protein
MLIQNQIRRLKREDIYSTNLEEHTKILHNIFQKIHNINVEEENKKKKYRFFFSKKDDNISNTDSKYKIPIYLSQYKYKKLYVDKKKKYRDLATGRKIIDCFTEEEINNLDNILENTNIKIYQTSWTKLAESLKLNRIHNFVKNLSKQYNLKEQYTSKLERELFNAIKTKQLTKSNQIDYDIENGKINNIYSLKHNPETNTFLLNN